jgi:calpain-5
MMSRHSSGVAGAAAAAARGGDDFDRINSSINEFKKQNYNRIKSTCLQEGKLFVDNLFPPNDTSLFRHQKVHGIEWKRPKVRRAPIGSANKAYRTTAVYMVFVLNFG